MHELHLRSVIYADLSVVVGATPTGPCCTGGVSSVAAAVVAVVVAVVVGATAPAAMVSLEIWR